LQGRKNSKNFSKKFAQPQKMWYNIFVGKFGRFFGGFDYPKVAPKSHLTAKGGQYGVRRKLCRVCGGL